MMLPSIHHETARVASRREGQQAKETSSLPFEEGGWETTTDLPHLHQNRIPSGVPALGQLDPTPGDGRMEQRWGSRFWCWRLGRMGSGRGGLWRRSGCRGGGRVARVAARGVTQLTPKSQCHVAGSLEELFGGHEVA